MTLKVVGDLDGGFAVASGLPQLLRDTPGVEATGFVADDDLGELLQQAKVFIVPIRWATGILTKQTLAHVHGLPTVVTPTAAKHIAPAPLDAGGRGDAWSHELGRYEALPASRPYTRPRRLSSAELDTPPHRTPPCHRYVPVRVALVAADAADFAAAVMQLHRNDTLWNDLSTSAARFARSGGGGKGVCPSGVGDDWLAFWAKLQISCSGQFS